MKRLGLVILILAATFQVAYSEDSLSIKVHAFEDAVALDISSAFNEVFVLDRAQSKLYKFNASGKLEKAIGGFGVGKYAFNDPQDVTASFGVHVFVADAGNQRIVQYDRWLNYIASLERLPALNSQETTYDLSEGFSSQKWRPVSLSLSPDGELYVLEETSRQIIRINPFDFPKTQSQWRSVLKFGGYDAGMGLLQSPYQVKLSAARMVYVSDSKQQAILAFDQFGNYITQVSESHITNPKALSLGALKTIKPETKPNTQCLVACGHKSVSFYEIKKGSLLIWFANLEKEKLAQAIGAKSSIRSIVLLRNQALILTQKALFKISSHVLQDLLQPVKK